METSYQMKHPPRNIVIDWLNTLWSTDLPSNAKLVACNLRRYMNSQNDMAWPSVPRIAGECGLSENCVRTHLKVLCADGWLQQIGKSKLDTYIYQAQTPPSIIEPPQPLTQTPSTIEGKLNNELNKSLSKRFTPPSVEQLVAYQKEKGFTFDPENFIDYWSSVGWKRGRTPMKDWKSTARTWARNENNGNTTKPPRSNTNTRRFSNAELARREHEKRLAASRTSDMGSVVNPDG
jgi:predicted DNA-binding transcriptional regulator